MFLQESIVKEYFEKKKEVDKQSAELKELSAKIKTELEKEEVDEIDTEEFTVSRSIVNQDRIREDALIEELQKCLSEELQEKVIKKKLYLDLDNLEDLCYNRIISSDLIAKFIEHREPQVRLYVKRRIKNGDYNY